MRGWFTVQWRKALSPLRLLSFFGANFENRVQCQAAKAQSSPPKGLQARPMIAKDRRDEVRNALG